MIATAQFTISTVNDGVGIASSIIDYSVSSSGTTPPGNIITDGSGNPILSNDGKPLTDGSWTTTLPDVPEGQYLWTRTRFILSDGSFDMIYNVSYSGEDGATGAQGVSVTKVSTEYRLSDSSTSMTGSGTGYSWSETMPKCESGQYIWKRERTDLSNGASVYSNATCDITTSEVVFDVDQNKKAISQKVWANDISSSINTYDGTTAANMRERITQTETDISGITSTVSDHSTRISNNETNISSVQTTANQAADHISWMIDVDGKTASTFTFKSHVMELVNANLVVKDTAGSQTIISGGKIHANAITADMLATNAIKSTNYNSGVSGSDIPSGRYSTTGTFLNLTNGNIYTPNFSVNAVNGEAYLNGTIYANAGQIGDPGNAYWNIGTVTDSTWGSYAGLIANGNALIQSGKLTLSSDLLNSQNSGNYIKSGNYWYDFGLQVPDFDATGTIGGQTYKENFLYIRRISTQPTSGTLDSAWTYLFRVDKSGNIYWNGHNISDGTYLPLSGGTVDGDLTVTGTLTATASAATKLASGKTIQTNLASTSSASFDGTANITPGVTGTLGVGNGGTGATTFTSGAALIGNGSSAIQTRGIRNNTTVGALGWTSSSADNTLATTNTIAYWDGRYRTTNNDSNLEYVKLGKLGTVVTHDIEEFITTSGGTVDSLTATDLSTGNLVVTGAATFTNGLSGDLTGNVTGNISGSAGSVENSLKIQLNGGTTEGTNQFTYNGSAVKNINITKSSIGLGNVENTALSTWAGSANLTTTKVGTLAAAATKAVDTVIDDESTSTNLPTSAAVASFVEGKGYVTSSGVTSARVQATSPVVSSQNTAQSTTLNTTISLADAYGDTKNPYAAKTANYVLAGPSSGSAAAPSFRALVAADIPSLTKSKISDFPTTWALSSITGADDLKAIEGLTGTSGMLKKTAANTWALTTVVSGLSINNDKITVTKSDGSTQDLTINITGQVVSGATILSDGDGQGLNVGDASHPTYFSNGLPVQGNVIPTLTLNGSATTAASFYAPTGAGTNNQYLKSNGSGAPTWATFSKSTVGLGNVDNTADANKNVLTATKFASAQSVTLTGDTTGTASSQAGWSITTKTDRISTVGDNRETATTPNDYVNKIIFQGLKRNTAFGAPSNDTYSYVVGLRGWDNYSGGDAHELAFNNSGISRRNGSTTTWGDWYKLLDSGNYNTYSPKLDGTGATGTWGINISGNATTATTATSATYSYYPKFVSTNEIRFDINSKPSTATALYIGYKWSDGSADAKINRYIFGTGGGSGSIADVQASTFYGELSGNATTATTASRVSGTAGSVNADRHVWFSDSATETIRNYDDDFKYNPSTNTLTVANLAGNAATATKAMQDGSGNTITSTYVTLATAQTISGAKTFSAATSFTNTTASTSKTTGAVKVSGGVGVAGRVSANEVEVNNGCVMQFDATLNCLNFIFN